MKLFYFTSIDVGYVKDGSKQHIEGIVNNLHELGWEITLFSSLLGENKDQPSFPFAHVLIKKRNLGFVSQIFEQLKLFYKFLFLGGSKKPDIVYIRSAYTYVIPVFYAIWYKIPFFWEINGLAEIETSHKRLLQYAVKLENWVIRQAHGVFLVTEDLRKYFIKRSGLPVDKFIVIPNACDDAVIHSWCSIDKPNPRWRHTIGFVGAFQPRQGVDTLLKAVSFIKTEIPNVLLLIAGAGSCSQEYQELIERLGIKQNVEFAGFVSGYHIQSFLEPCGVTVAPYAAMMEAHPSCSPLKLYAYLGCGKIVVISDLSAFKRQFEYYPAVIFAEPDNPESFARAIIQVLKMDEARRCEIGRQGRQYILENHTWRQAAEKTANAIVSLIKISKVK